MNRYASFIATKDESNGNYEIALLSSKILSFQIANFLPYRTQLHCIFGPFSNVRHQR